MLNCLILTFHDWAVHLPSEELRKDLIAVIEAYYSKIMRAPEAMANLAEQYSLQGGRTMSRDEILREVDEGRGAIR